MILQVPDELLRQEVQCPSCGSIFVASAGSSPPPKPSAPKTPPRPQGKHAISERPFSSLIENPDRFAGGERDLSEFADEDEFDDRPRRRSRRYFDNRAQAAAAVIGPGIALLVVGILAILLGIANVAVVASDTGSRPGLHKDPANKAGQYVGSTVSLIWGCVVAMGGFKLMKLQAHGTAKIAAIVAMVPCSLCCVVSFPLGIWALTVMHRPEVHSAFE
jgi:hypothetical protein